MKIKFKIVIMMSAILVLAACPQDNSNTYKGLGERLNLSGQVVTREFTTNFIGMPAIEYINYPDNIDISDGGIGGTGSVINGRLSYSIGKPALSSIDEGLELLYEMYDNISFSSNDVNAALVNLSAGSFSLIQREKTGDPVLLSMFPFSIQINSEIVHYVYVDKDVIVMADGDEFTYNEFLFPINLTTEKINLGLKKGWNPLYAKITATAYFENMNINDLSDITLYGNLSLSLSNPSLNWTLTNTNFSP